MEIQNYFIGYLALVVIIFICGALCALGKAWHQMGRADARHHDFIYQKRGDNEHDTFTPWAWPEFKWPLVRRSTFDDLDDIRRCLNEGWNKTIDNKLSLIKDCDEFNKEIDGLHEEMASLRAQLARAQLNDTERDPVSGRWVRKAPKK